MKLRNKRTGEIIEWEQPISYKVGKKYYSLAELSADWEDYEEPEGYWSISCGEAIYYTWDGEKYDRATEAVGLKFDTKEECERAIEKMKSWKRLRGKRFRFKRWTIPEEPKTSHIKLVIEAEMDVPVSPYDLDLLFGGEE